ncbi:MAG: hypothetical protein NTY12_04515 [Candidatus Falkowbacteria bacterium]|nr:hypothetical protein [Candidatus Falkowbacteria bacterium]
MTNEQIILPEIPQEHVPTPEEVNSVFKELIKKEYTEIRKLEDEKGLYILEVTVPGELEGELLEYAYMRKGRHPEGESSTDEIHVTYYKNNIPYGGTSAARCIEGQWKIL